MIKLLNEGFEKLINETSCKESDTRRFDRRGELGGAVAKYQRWVDYDMKRFGRISKRTTDTLRKVGLDVTKDQYGDYEVIAKSPIEEAKTYGARVFTYKVGDKTYRFYCHTEDTKYGFKHICDVFFNGQPVAYATAKYYNRTWESFEYQSVMKKAVDGISNATEDEKKDLKDQIEDGEGIREGCEAKKCNEATKEGNLTRKERIKFITRLTTELSKEPFNYDWDEANDIAIKRADALHPSWRVRWDNDLDKQIKQELEHTVTKDEFERGDIIREKKCNEANEPINKKGEQDIIAWWDEVEKWNRDNGSTFTIDNDKSDIEGMHSAMFDMLRELKDKAEDLYKRGKSIYNRYAVSKINESDDDDDISDDEYYAELEAHIKRIPSYEDDDLKAEYKEFKDSIHEDDKRVEDALFAEMVKRGFIKKTDEGYEYIWGDKVLAYRDLGKAKEKAKEMGLKEAEYGDIGDSLKDGYAYCYWNKSGDRNDTEEVIAYYKFDKNGKARPLTDEEAEAAQEKFELTFDDFDVDESCK